MHAPQVTKVATDIFQLYQRAMASREVQKFTEIFYVLYFST